MKPSFSKEKFNGLNSLRFFACSLIFVAHSFTSFHIAYLGMNLFFVLSSFLLTYSALIEIQNKSNFSRVNFFARRAIRIYPLYFAIVIGLIYIAPLLLNTAKDSIGVPKNPLYYFLFLSNYDFSDHLFALKFLWSIAVEEQFYILFILFSYFFKKYFWLPVCILLSGYFIYMLYADMKNLNTYMHLCTYFSNFAVGMIGGWLYFYKGENIKPHLISFLICLTISLIIVDYDILNHLLIAVCLMNLIAITIYAFKKYTLLNTYFKITEKLGRYSYGLYALSGIVITIGLKYPITSFYELQVLFNFIGLIAISALSYHYFEAHFLKLKAKFYA